MAYVSLYRKYRSQTFSDLVGQDHVVRTLQNAITSGRIAHSYLFTGPRGTGKTSSARLLAKALCCEKGPTAEPCNVCSICLSITEGSCIDVYEMDAASESGVEDVRDTIVAVSEYAPAFCRYKVFIIDEVHDLSPKAFDALLKTIEEPPPHIIFVLATTEYNKVPPTIRSRCQKFEFHRASMADLVARLQHVVGAEGLTVEPAALETIARSADGGFRDALTLLEQAIASTGGTIALKDIYDQLGLVAEDVSDGILLAMRAGDIGKLIELSNELTRIGRDPRTVLESLLYRMAELTRVLYNVDSGGTVDASRQAAAHDLAARLGTQALLFIRGELAEAHRVIRDISLPRLWLESEMIRVSGALQATRGEAKTQPTPAASATPPKPEPVRTVEKPIPKPTAEVPASKIEPTEPQAPAVAAVSTQTPRDPQLNKALEVWSSVLNDLPPKTPIRLKLEESNVIGFDNGRLTVELARQMDLDWINDKSVRHSHILSKLHEHGAANWQIEYRVRSGSTKGVEPVAVELPAEGQRLADLAREVFQQK